MTVGGSDVDSRLPRYLGAAFLAVFATSLASGLIATGILAGGMSEVFVNISGTLARVRASNLLQLLTSVGIIVLASFLYLVLRDQSRPMALVAYGWWLAEAVMLAVSALGAYALMTLAAEPATATSQTVGRVFLGLQQNAYTVHMLFFCLGGILWYWLLFESRIVPRWLSVWGLAGVVLLLVSILLTLWDRSLDLGILPGLPYAPFELVVGLWLLVAGGRTPIAQVDTTRGN
jgi:hypothetical protein